MQADTDQAGEEGVHKDRGRLRARAGGDARVADEPRRRVLRGRPVQQRCHRQADRGICMFIFSYRL